MTEGTIAVRGYLKNLLKDVLVCTRILEKTHRLTDPDQIIWNSMWTAGQSELEYGMIISNIGDVLIVVEIVNWCVGI